MRVPVFHLPLAVMLVGGSLSLAPSGTVFASSIEDADSVEEAVQEIIEELEDDGADIVRVINHSANAANVGLTLRPTTVIFARDPKTEVKLIRRGQTVGIDLPQKFLVWEDESGEIHLKVNGVGYLADRHGIKIKDRDLLSLNNKGKTKPDGSGEGLITIDSSLSVPDAVAAISDTLANAGFFIPLVIDYPAESGGSGNSLRPTTLMVFGRPQVGTQLMQASQEIGIDLPQKFLVWEDKDGQTHITWNDPFFIAQRAGVEGLDTLLGNISNALANFAASGAGTGS